MTVDLDRLRVALSDWVDDRFGIAGGSDTLEQCAEAVLDAPTVRWCERHRSIATSGDPNNCQLWVQGAIGACLVSVRALVPVKGETE